MLEHPVVTIQNRKLSNTRSLKKGSVNFNIWKNVEHFLVWLSSNLSIQKSPTSEIIKSILFKKRLRKSGRPLNLHKFTSLFVVILRAIS